MNDNTILRIKVPAHLYESVKEQLTINEAKKSKHHYGAGMEVVKEKKLSKDGMKKVEEVDKVEENINEAIDPNLIAGIIGILFGSLPLLYKIIKDYRAAKTPEDKKKVLSQAASTISGKMSGNMEEGINELFGLGKSKNQFKPGQKVTYTASNGTTEYNGEYIVGKVYDNGEVGLYSPDSPMKKITINAKPENLKSA